MRKTDVLAHFGTQKRVADELTAAGFKISPRNVSKLPELIPLKWATPLAHLMRRKLDLSLYRDGAHQ